MIKIGILTVSDSSSRGKRADKSGPVIKQELRQMGKTVEYQIIPDDKEKLKDKLINWSDNLKLDLILTTGGTGLGPRDITPEATSEVINREIPGISEIIRLKTFDKSTFSVLSRGRSGIRKRSLIINLPGSPTGARECLTVIKPILTHAIEVIQGRERHEQREVRGDNSGESEG